MVLRGPRRGSPANSYNDQQSQEVAKLNASRVRGVGGRRGGEVCASFIALGVERGVLTLCEQFGHCSVPKSSAMQVVSVSGQKYVASPKCATVW